jgi:hypothetical protein
MEETANMNTQHTEEPAPSPSLYFDEDSMQLLADGTPYTGGYVRITQDGDIFWCFNSALHREPDEDGLVGPAVICSDGTEYWYKDGLPHREGGPAINDKYISCWCINGRLHREDGPAVVTKSGEGVCWMRDGKLHREDGPAYFFNGLEEWFIDGRPHRVGGPALIKQNGEPRWYIDGVRHNPDGTVYDGPYEDEPARILAAHRFGIYLGIVRTMKPPKSKLVESPPPEKEQDETELLFGASDHTSGGDIITSE